MASLESSRLMCLVGYHVGQTDMRDSVRDWLRSSPRKPPELAFTASPERDLAHEIERAIQAVKAAPE